MLVYPEYMKLPSLDRMREIVAKVEAKPESERNEWASILLSGLVRELMPTVETNGDYSVRDDVVVELKRAGVVQAIILARARLGCGLREAKDYVERIRDEKLGG